MKLGLCTWCYYGNPWEDICKKVKEFGLEAIEVGAGGFNGKVTCNPVELLHDSDKFDRFKKALTKNGLIISAISCHGNPLHPNKQIAKEHSRDVELAIELANKLGVKVINCLAGCPGAGVNAIYPNWIGESYPVYSIDCVKWQWEKKVIPFWRKMVIKAKKFGVKFGFEMLVGDVVYNTETLLKLREEVGSEEISCSLDPAHLFWHGIDVIACIKRLGNMIVSVHAQDSKINKTVVDLNGVIDWKHYADVVNRAWNFKIVGYGHGTEFWKEFVSSLRMQGFDGVLSIEHQDSLMSVQEGIYKAIDFLNKVIYKEKPEEVKFCDRGVS